MRTVYHLTRKDGVKQADGTIKYTNVIPSLMDMPTTRDDILKRLEASGINKRATTIGYTQHDTQVEDSEQADDGKWYAPIKVHLNEIVALVVEAMKLDQNSVVGREPLKLQRQTVTQFVEEQAKIGNHALALAYIQANAAGKETLNAFLDGIWESQFKVNKE